MASRTFNVNTTPRGYRKNDDAGGRIRDNNVYIGVVKNNEDGQRMGRLAVWIPEIGGNPNDEQNWIIVSYASPFAGVTPSSELVHNSVVMAGSQQSYGFWMQAPDLDNQVLVCFVNGDIAKGFWFACVWQQNMNHMVPGIPSGSPTVDTEACGAQPPVVEYNKRSDDISPSSPKRPVFTPLNDGLSSEGLYHDQERGPSTSGARREAPSKVFGWLTPRGNTIHVDDNPNNEFIRMRTRSGAQVMISETTGFVYINSKNGNSWVEISDKGVDIYSQGSVSLRSEGSLNLHADGSLNIEADGNLNLRAGGNLTMQSAHHTDIAGNGRLVLDFGGKLSAKAGGDVLLQAGGNLRQGAGGDISASSAGANLRSASIINDDGGAPEPGAISAIVEKTQSVSEVNGSAPCFTQDTRQSIVRKMPTHEPWSGHQKIGEIVNDVDTTGLSSKDFASASDAKDVGDAAVVEGGPAEDISKLNPNDLDWLATCIMDEANNQIPDGKAAVAQIIKNRIARKDRGNTTIKDTVLSPKQFSGFYYENVNGKYTQVAHDEAQAEQRGLQKMAKYQRSPKWAEAKRIGEQVMKGTYETNDPVFQKMRANKRATQYLNYDSTKSLNSSGVPAWASDSKRIGKIDDHTFYFA